MDEKQVDNNYNFGCSQKGNGISFDSMANLNSVYLTATTSCHEQYLAIILIQGEEKNRRLVRVSHPPCIRR